jgi:hypothetical protein
MALPDFPWHYLEQPTEAAADAAARWIYSAFADKAYQGFVERGRGYLVGPFLTDHTRNPITVEEFVAQRNRAGAVGLTVVYAAADSQTLLPEEPLQQPLLAAIDRYDPERECVILLLANNAPYMARIVGTNSTPQPVPDACSLTVH